MKFKENKKFSSEIRVEEELKRRGFTNIRRVDYRWCYDFLADKDGKRYYIEAKTRKTKYLTINIPLAETQFSGLLKLKDLLFIIQHKDKFEMFPFEKVLEYVHIHENASNKGLYTYMFNVYYNIEKDKLELKEPVYCQTCKGRYLDWNKEKRDSSNSSYFSKRKPTLPTEERSTDNLSKAEGANK